MGEAGATAAAPPAVLTSPPSTSSTATDTRSSPAFSVSASGLRTGRNLRQKVVDEIKSVRVRKSPAGREKDKAKDKDKLPPPLELNHEPDADEEEAEDPLQPAAAKAKGCSICERSFTVFRAKHTCKLCAQKICDDCSKNRMKLHRRLERKKGSRLCDPCARSVMNADAGSGEDADAFPDASPTLAATHSECTLPSKPGDATKGLSRRHSVPAKSFPLAKGKSGAASAAAATAIAKQASPAQKTAATANGSHAGISKMRGVAPVRRAVHLSHLRTRHWMSLLAVAVLVALRVVYYTRSSGAEGSGGTEETAVVAPPPYSFVEHALDNLLAAS
ncbi:glycolipid transfer protein domain-containing protein 1-like [Phytophthora cinnamomi]|uniref:glycolipid transfer protein domain-containing protein 1-like n=1 Tax=Phytophthora cinnamomi TaxID=4785 RepID=UPI00355AA8B2|nr:glycolipid transfer protein domain-containing protein 1-like [Phytophthora cinnamomi]